MTRFPAAAPLMAGATLRTLLAIHVPDAIDGRVVVQVLEHPPALERRRTI